MHTLNTGPIDTDSILRQLVDQHAHLPMSVVKGAGDSRGLMPPSQLLGGSVVKLNGSIENTPLVIT